MSEFSTTDAALEGFRIARENPRAVGVWWGVYLVAIAAMTTILASNGGYAALGDLQTAAAPGANPEAVLPAMSSAMGKLAAAALPLIVAQILVQAGVLRVILAPEGRRSPLGLGGDELRVLLASVVIALVAFALVVACSLVLGILSLAIGPVVGFLSFVATIAIFIVVSVRFSLLAPLAISAGRVNPAEAWRLTKGRFHRILGALAIALILGLVTSILGSTVLQAIGAVAGITGDVPTTVGQAFSPARVAILVVNALLQALSAVVMIAPTAIIYRSLAPSSRAEVF